MLIRTAATLLLALQLSQLGLPVLCPTARSLPSDPCSQAMPSSTSGALVTPNSHGHSCASTALCAAVLVAVPAPHGGVLSVAAASRREAWTAQSLVQVDPNPPLSPPPQA